MGEQPVQAAMRSLNWQRWVNSFCLILFLVYVIAEKSRQRLKINAIEKIPYRAPLTLSLVCFIKGTCHSLSTVKLGDNTFGSIRPSVGPPKDSFLRCNVGISLTCGVQNRLLACTPRTPRADIASNLQPRARN